MRAKTAGLFRGITLAALTLLALLLAANPAMSRATAEGAFDRTLKVTGAVDLSVSTGSGHISVRKGAPGAVSIHGTIRASESWHLSSEEAERKVRYLEQNPSYVFFTETQGGPYGSLGARVTARASIATDKEVFPRGALALVDAKLGGAPFRQFVLDQDTGGAIRSAGRCDIFAGTGPDAERVAGSTMAVGRLYYFFLKPAAMAGGSVVPAGLPKSERQ